MPYALVVIGLLLIITGIRNTHAQLGAELKADFTGQGNFTYWVIALGIVGAAGYVKDLRGISRLFMTIILASMFLSRTNQGFFPQFTAAIKAGPETITPAAAENAPASPSTTPASAVSSITGLPTPSFKESLKKPGGGGFWDYMGIPSPF